MNMDGLIKIPPECAVSCLWINGKKAENVVSITLVVEDSSDPDPCGAFDSRERGPWYTYSETIP